MPEEEMKRRLTELENAMFGLDRRGGVVAGVAEIVTTLQEDRRHRDMRDQEIKDALQTKSLKNTAFWTMMVAVIAAMALMLGWLTFREGQRHADNTYPAMGSNQTTQQHATAPYVMR